MMGTKTENLTNFRSNPNQKISAINDHIDADAYDILICASDDMIPHVDGWDNEMVYSRQLARLTSKGSDKEADTEDDWIIGGDGRFKRVPRGFIVETLEKNKSVMSE